MSTDPILDPTAATEAALDIESIKEIMDAFDPASLLPELGDILSLVTGVCRGKITELQQSDPYLCFCLEGRKELAM